MITNHGRSTRVKMTGDWLLPTRNTCCSEALPSIVRFEWTH